MLDDEWDGEDRNLRFIAERAHGFVKTESARSRAAWNTPAKEAARWR